MLRKNLIFRCMYLVEYNSADLFIILGSFSMLCVALQFQKKWKDRKFCLSTVKKFFSRFEKKNQLDFFFKKGKICMKF